MRTVDDLEVSYAQFEKPEVETDRGLFERLRRNKLITISFIVVLAFCVRVYRLDAAGLAEDETNKVFALRAYEQSDFTVNSEHPMLMKMLCYASRLATGLWNASLGERVGLAVSDETALRLPNVTFGALTVIPLFLLTTTFFGFRVGLITSLLWAFGLNAVWFNRVGKEDTLLLFFILTAFYLYNRAKEQPESEPRRQEFFYALAGAAFGLMLCSKYFPHFFGLNALFYYLAGYDSRNNRPLGRRVMLVHFAALMVAFVAFNPAAFIPQTWRYLWQFVNEDLITHHGNLVMDQLYVNDASESPFGTPWYFYYLFLAVKLPLPLIVSFLVGLIEIFRHRGRPAHARGYLFLRMMLFFWLFPMALIGSKFLRYTLSLTPLVYMTAAVGTMVLWRGLSAAVARLEIERRFARAAAAVAVGLVFVILPAVTTVRAMPYPNLYLNSLGGGRVGYFFPHDEFYDVGARESVKFIAETAPAGAVVASEIPGVVQFYLERYGRRDIRSEIISHPEFSLANNRPDYVMLQRGRVYFENLDTFREVEGHFPVVQSSVFDGAAATKVYLTTGSKPSQ